MIAYRVIRSDRKTMVLQVNAEGVTVRAPLRFDDARIRRFVEEHTDWIEQKLQKHLAIWLYLDKKWLKQVKSVKKHMLNYIMI